MTKKIIIIGAGPTGLGAAWRLQELKYPNWQLFEQRDKAGGLAASYKDNQGFTWDMGGHVLFSHYDYFDNLMKELLADDWYAHERESWIWIFNRFIPYPFQYNIRHLPKEEFEKCLNDLIEVQKNPSQEKPKNFEEWLLQGFGKRIAEIFMLPYNYQVWGYHPRKMQYNWIGERVAQIDLERLLNNIREGNDDVSWGPNNTFNFPKYGGTGKIWSTLAERLNQNRLNYNAALKKIDIKNKKITLTDGQEVDYDLLITTMPLDKFIERSNLDELKKYQDKFLHSAVHVVGLGIKGEKPEHLKTKCWKYFPEYNCPHYRSTVFSNYSKNNVPDINQYWSLMLETAESPDKEVDINKIANKTVQGAINTHLIKPEDELASVSNYREEYAYPTPFLERDALLNEILPLLLKYSIYSRGRFGAWKYEVGNMDHSVMQGVEAVNNILNGDEEITLNHPEIVNKR